MKLSGIVQFVSVFAITWKSNNLLKQRDQISDVVTKKLTRGSCVDASCRGIER